MFSGTPEQRLWLVNQRQAQLIHEAEQHRLATANRDKSADNPSIPPFNWAWRRLGQLFARIRALPLREEPCNDPCPE
jgi:hypothetical protein